MIKIAVIIGSTRPGRNGEAVGRWVHEIAKKRSDAEFELVDIKDFNLPLLDEAITPSRFWNRCSGTGWASGGMCARNVATSM